MTKKICSSQSRNSSIDVMDFSYPVYHDTGKKSYVDFRAYDPATGTVRRKKYHLDNIKSKKERRLHANLLITKLVKKLSTGWRPWHDDITTKGYADFEQVLDLYLKNVEKTTTRSKTVHAYTSRVNVLREYISTLPYPIKYAYQFDRQFVNEFLDWIIIDRDAGPRTRNNYKGWCSVFAEFMIQRKYIDSNPTEGISKLVEKEKKRQPLTKKMLQDLNKYLNEHDRYFLLAVLMEYYTFIRPTELTNLRIQDFSIKDQRVFVSGSFSKNKKDGYVGVNETLIRLMLDLHVFDHPGDDYLFSTNFKPGVSKVRADIFNKRWVNVRKRLGWGDEYQFYSLKDSGIRDLANSAGVVIARDQARHQDIATTNKYLGHEKGVRQETKSFEGFLSTPDDKTPL